MAWSERYRCPRCGTTTGRPGALWECPRCGYPLSLENLGNSSVLGKLPRHYLGEGGAPVVEWRRKGGLRALLSLEYLNPTGSFKDLGASVVVGHMKSLGVYKGVVDSSGNSAISFSYYARSAGLEPIVVVPRDAPRGKLSLIRASGTRVVLAGSRQEASRLAQELASKGAYYAGHTLNPYFTAGVSWRFLNIFNIFRETGACREGGQVDVVAPLSSGSLVLGAWYAYRALAGDGGYMGCRLRLWGVIPRCIYRPSYEGRVSQVIDLGEEGSSCSLLDALRISRPPRLEEILEALGTGGLFLVDDVVVRRWWPRVLSWGFIVEPSSSVVLAAVDRILEWGGEGVVLGVLTGSGLKYVEKLILPE